jgi:adenosylhomocysteine nucleosidase
MTCDVLLQAAIEEEFAPVLAALSAPTATEIGPWTFWCGAIDGRSVVLSRTDEGPLNVSAASALGIDRFRPRAVINFGIAGAHNPDLHKGDLVIAKESVDYSGFRSTPASAGEGIDCRRWMPKPHKIRTSPGHVTRVFGFPSDPALVKAAVSLPYNAGKVAVGTVGTALQFNLEVDRILWLRETYKTDSEDQESAYAAGVAMAMRTPFVALRVISDTVFHDPVLDKSLGRLVGEFALSLVAELA